MKANQDTIETTLALRKSMGFKGRKPDPLRLSGRGENTDNQPDSISRIKYGYILTPNFSASKKKFAHNQVAHPCLHGKIAVTEYGDILPCIFSRQNVIGNYLDTTSLAEVVNSPALKKIWHTTKDNVNVCKDCEYRYMCFDCRPHAQANAGFRADYYSAPYPGCTYNPYSGEWGDGVWRVDEKGLSIYDESLAEQIKQVRRSSENSGHALGELHV